MAIAPRDVRALLPAASHHTYLNAAASSPLPLPVCAAVEEHLRDTVAHGDVAFPLWLERKDALRARIARFIGAETACVAFLPSTSVCFSVIAHLLKRRGLQQVLTLEGEFPSTTLPLLHAGLTLKVVRRRSDGSYPLADLEAALTPSTQAIALSAVEYSSGYRVDLLQVAALCRARGLKLAINAAQALGQVPIDVAAIGADFVCAPSHKWMMGGYGTAIFYARRDWHDPQAWPFVGWLSVSATELWRPFAGATCTAEEAGFLARGTSIRAEPSALEAGGAAWAALFALDAAMAIHEAIGVDATLAQVLKLQAQLRAALRSKGFVPNAPDDPAHLGGICTVGVEGDPGRAVSALLRAGVVTTARGGGVRISTHVFNDEEDLQRLYAAIDTAGLKPAR